jgi:hypothetical protein
MSWWLHLLFGFGVGFSFGRASYWYVRWVRHLKAGGAP